MEIEVKIRVKSLEDFEKKISFANFVLEECQRDTYFKMPEKTLLRVREIEGGSSVLGYKKILDEENTIFDEIESKVDNGTKAIEILKNLGFEELAVIKKLRRVYRYKNITMELNDVKGIGYLVDFEIISGDKKVKNEILRFIKSLGYSNKDIEPRLYTELTADK